MHGNKIGKIFFEIVLLIILFITFSKIQFSNLLITTKIIELEPINYIKSDKLHYCWIHIPEIMKNIKSIYQNNYYDYLKNKLSDMKIGTDNISKSTLDYVYTCLVNSLNDKKCCPIDFFYTERDNKRFKDELAKGYYDKFIIEKKCQEVFYTHHGLRFAKKPILDYIKDKDIIDAGAFIGDSALVLANYTSRKIYSYEASHFNYLKCINTTKANNIEDKVVPLLLGLSDKSGILYSNSTDVSIGNTLYNEGKNPVYITTIDNEVEKRNLIPGFIKADTEGYEYKILIGALKTIKKYRPILSISIYHNKEGLFDIPDLIKTFGNYHIEYRSPSQTPDFSELILFAYPAEINNDESPVLGDE